MIREGIVRIRNLVRDLLNFLRLGEANNQALQLSVAGCRMPVVDVIPDAASTMSPSYSIANSPPWWRFCHPLRCWRWRLLRVCLPLGAWEIGPLYAYGRRTLSPSCSLDSVLRRFGASLRLTLEVVAHHFQ